MKNNEETQKNTGSVHKTVLLNETIDGLNLRNDATVLDATFGGGGHSLEILKRFPNIKIIAIDQDASTWQRAKDKFVGKKVIFLEKNFRETEGLGNFDGIIFDLGLSSDQLENSGRGFSFMKNEPLLMTMKANLSKNDLTAEEIVNNWEEKNMISIFRGYGEERFSKKIAKAIVDAREEKEIKTTFELVDIIRKSVPISYQKGKLHFATRTFQALRIATNDELRALEEGLQKAFEILKKGGRMSVISFHSLEDRIVKNFFRDKNKKGEALLINKKPITPSEEELNKNIRARSAKLRILEKI